jgi:hypothetical protein
MMRASIVLFAASVVAAMSVVVACGEMIPASVPADGGAPDAATDAAADAADPDADPPAENIAPTPEDAAPAVVVVVDDAGAPDVVTASDGGSTCASGEQSIRLGPQSAQAKSGDSTTFTTFGKSAYWGALSELGAGDGDSTYVLCKDDGGKAEWMRLDHTDATGLSGRQITRVSVFVRARKEDEAVTAVGAVGIYASGNAYVGPDVPLATTYAVYANSFSSHPVSKAAWTSSQVDNFELYISCLVPNGGKIRFTQLWAEVCVAP